MIVVGLAVFVGVLMPLYAVYLAWTGRRGGRLAWLLKGAGAVGFMGFLTLIARWDFLSVYLVWFWWAVLALVLVLGLAVVWNRRWIYGETRGALLATALEPVIAFGLFGYAALGLLHDGATELDWPLRDGRFIVGQGGNTAMINYHNVNPAQRYALDIVELDEFGRRADGISPDLLPAYVIYGHDVVSPCAGTVVAIRDGIADNAIGATNVEEPGGNHVVLDCGGVEVLLAHFQPATVAVAAGDAVTVGQPLGKVGNSGNSSEPHLHLHAVRKETGGILEGEGTALTFGGVFPVRNTIIEN